MEKANASANQDAEVIRGGGLLEVAKLHGHFDVVCIGPREEDRELYNQIQKNIY